MAEQMVGLNDFGFVLLGQGPTYSIFIKMSVHPCSRLTADQKHAADNKQASSYHRHIHMYLAKQ